MMKAYDLPHWNAMFSPDQSLVESCLRGTIIYLIIFFIMRVLPKRQSGEMSMTDMVLIVLVAEAASQSMIGESFSMPNGIVLICTLFFWNFFLQWLAIKFPALDSVLHAKPLIIIKNGQPIEKNLQREQITDELLQSELREQGIDDIDKVKEAHVEGDGKVSFLEK